MQNKESFMVKRIKHNNLLPWFTDDHGTLPASYLRKCEKFFQTIQDRLITKKDAAFLFKLQASSAKLDKPQASSYSRIIKENKKC